jgi:hypothetical protein
VLYGWRGRDEADSPYYALILVFLAGQGALNFGVIQSLSACITLMGIAVLYALTGQLGLGQLRDSLSGPGTVSSPRRCWRWWCTAFW